MGVARVLGCFASTEIEMYATSRVCSMAIRWVELCISVTLVLNCRFVSVKVVCEGGEEREKRQDGVRVVEAAGIGFAGRGLGR